MAYHQGCHCGCGQYPCLLVCYCCKQNPCVLTFSGYCGQGPCICDPEFYSGGIPGDSKLFPIPSTTSWSNCTDDASDYLAAEYATSSGSDLGIQQTQGEAGYLKITQLGGVAPVPSYVPVVQSVDQSPAPAAPTAQMPASGKKEQLDSTEFSTFIDGKGKTRWLCLHGGVQVTSCQAWGYSSLQALEIHVDSGHKHKGKPWPCECGVNCTDRGNLRRHKRETCPLTARVPVEGQVCRFCGKDKSDGRRKGNFKRHEKKCEEKFGERQVFAST